MSEKNSASNSSDQLAASFVPAILKKQYASNPTRKIGDPLKEDHTALLWIDMCNFSPLCNRLMKDNVSGVEKITEILNNHYEFVVKSITESGGQPLFFVGDGLMSVWPGDKKKAQESVALAAACAHHIINSRSTVDDNNELLSIHVILTMGAWQMDELEGLHGNLLTSFFGEVFNDLISSSKNRAPNQLLISNTALACLNKELKSKPVEYETSILLDAPMQLAKPATSKLYLADDAIQKLKSFVPPTLTFPLNKERLKWIAEIRPVNILFVKLPNSSRDASVNLKQLREFVALAKPIVLKHDGLLSQVWMDEKDSNILICFGPPPSAHVDNPERSVLLAFELHNLLKQSGFENSVGVSSGMAYCGILGNDVLRQYTVIGDVVNLSARLAGIKKNTIFCDKATFKASNKVVKYNEPVVETVKGRTEPVTLYVPERILDSDQIKSNIHISIGRKKELTQLMDAFQSALQGKNSCLIVEGDSGMGKSQLLEDFKKQILTGNGYLLFTAGDFIERNTPYRIWGNIFSSMLGLDGVESGKNQNEALDEIANKYGSRACLLNIVLQTNFPESDEIKNLTAAQKVAATCDFLLNQLEEASKKQPLAIVFDDAQWMDETSWRLIESANAKLNNCLIVLSFQKTEGIEYIKTLQLKNTERVILKEFSDEDIEKLICAKLGVIKISDEVAGILKKIAKGNPFFCLELAGSLQDQQLFTIENNQCTLIKDAVINDLTLPETVRGAVRMRIDRLDQGSQLSLKVGSVVGNRFGIKIISSIYPIKMERKSVPSYLNEAKQSGFLSDSVVDNLEGYLFNNATTAEVAYEMTLAEQRRYLHRESAEWYEENFRENLHPFYVRLAHHWQEANEKNKAANYHEMEAIRLFRLGFAKQALNFGLEGVKLLNQNIERDLPSIGQKIGENLGTIGALMHNQTIESLLNQKKLEDKDTGKVIKMLLELCPFAHICQQGELFALMSIICLRLTLEQGNGESAAEVYSLYSVIHKALTGDSATALAWSNLAISVDDKNKNTLQSRVGFVHCWFIAHWLVPVKELIPIAQVSADAGFKSGDIVFACFNLSLEVILKSLSGEPLQDVIDKARIHFLRNNQMVLNAAFHLIHEEQVAKAFQGRTKSYTSLTDEKYDEENDVASICATDLYNQIAYYLVSKLKLNAHFGNWEEAIGWGEKALPLLPTFANQPGHIDLEYFFTIAALYRAVEIEREGSLNLMNTANAGIDKINAWANLCPNNFSHKAILLQAIREGFLGNPDDAEKMFEQAAGKALAADYIQDCGLAYEHLARMQSRLNVNNKTALSAAIDAYTKWGAEGKINYLRAQFFV